MNDMEVSLTREAGDLPNQDADDLAVKAALAFKIKSIIEGRRLSDPEAAELLSITTAEIPRLRDYQLEQFSAGRLMRFLVLLDHDVEICVRERQEPEATIRAIDIRARAGWSGMQRGRLH